MKMFKKLLTLCFVCLFLLVPVSVYAEESSTESVSSEAESTIETSSNEPTEETSSTASVSSKTTTQTSSKSKTTSSKNTVSATTNTEAAKNSSTVVTGKINDEIDNSGWGSQMQTSDEGGENQTPMASGKKILNLAKVIWFVIWIPIALIIASIVMLIRVNRKSFVENTAESGKTKQAKKRRAANKKSSNDHIYRPHD